DQRLAEGDAVPRHPPTRLVVPGRGGRAARDGNHDRSAAEYAGVDRDLVRGVVDDDRGREKRRLVRRGLAELEACGAGPRLVAFIADRHRGGHGLPGRQSGGQGVVEHAAVERGRVVEQRGSGGGRSQIFIGIVGCRPRIGIRITAARLYIRRVRLYRAGVDAGAFVVFVEALDVDAVDAVVDLAPRVLIMNAAGARKEVSRIAYILIPV